VKSLFYSLPDQTANLTQPVATPTPRRPLPLTDDRAPPVSGRSHSPPIRRRSPARALTAPPRIPVQQRPGEPSPAPSIGCPHRLSAPRTFGGRPTALRPGSASSATLCRSIGCVAGARQVPAGQQRPDKPSRPTRLADALAQSAPPRLPLRFGWAS
jgi:hypothetical protein